jgi:hypothetical protein
MTDDEKAAVEALADAFRRRAYTRRNFDERSARRLMMP